MNYFFIFLAVVLGACSTPQSKSTKTETLPEWIEAIDKYCSKNEICAIGEGTGLVLAEASARSGIVKHFKTQIKTSFEQTTSLTNMEQNSSYSEEIEELADDVMSGITIKERYESKDGFYVLASLSKSFTKNFYSNKISELDKQISLLYRKGMIGDYYRALQLYPEREAYNEKYYVVASKFKSSVIPKDIIQKKIDSAINGVSLWIEIISPDIPEILKIVQSSFSQMGYKVIVTSDQINAATHVVKGQLSLEKMHLKVEGFEKYKLLLTLEGAKIKDDQKKVIKSEVVTTGRDKNQAILSGIEKIEEYLKSNLADLNIQN